MTVCKSLYTIRDTQSLSRCFIKTGELIVLINCAIDILEYKSFHTNLFFMEKNNLSVNNQYKKKIYRNTTCTVCQSFICYVISCYKLEILFVALLVSVLLFFFIVFFEFLNWVSCIIGHLVQRWEGFPLLSWLSNAWNLFLANFPVTSEFPWTWYRGGQASIHRLVIFLLCHESIDSPASYISNFLAYPPNFTKIRKRVRGRSGHAWKLALNFISRSRSLARERWLPIYFKLFGTSVARSPIRDTHWLIFESLRIFVTSANSLFSVSTWINKN